ncbi:hypothetical protein ACRS9C_11440 [Serratia marcescens]|uniref:hypothetical protein n=1 Tax=Serratia marcescens TaxID=615 RepID=UPI003EE11B7A
MKKDVFFLLLPSLLLSACISEQPYPSAVSVTTYNTGIPAGNWEKKEWITISTQVIWRKQYDSALFSSCTAGRDCAVAVGTAHKEKFYPRAGFISISYGTHWEEVQNLWLLYHGVEKAFSYPEKRELLSPNDSCSTVGVYWGKDEDGGYSQWKPVPGSHCAPFSGQIN